MRSARLSLALDQGVLSLPMAGRVLVLNPGGTDDFSALPRDRVHAVQGFRPDHDALAARGIAVTPELPEGPFAAAILCLPRSRAQARALVAAACAVTEPGGPVAVDGQKDDGIDSLLKDIRARAPVGEPLAKAHGRLAVFPAGPGFADWQDTPRDIGGFVTRAGVFSADGPDPGSALLADALPAELKGRGVDLGAGWGFLSRAVLRRDGVKALDLVEADHSALACARANLPDPRAAFHWADATRFRPARPADFVVMNPPFHTGRAADPALGQAFLAAAAAMLAADGTLWLVANRALPYALPLSTLFRQVEDLPGSPAYRLTRASHPIRRKGPA
jgi:16S rRNA (guanine1207-N2)-methyltransferase